MYSPEYSLSKNEMWCAADNHNYVCHICAKEQIIDKISNFHEIDPTFTNSQKNHKFLIIIGTILLLPYKFQGRDM